MLCGFLSLALKITSYRENISKDHKHAHYSNTSDISPPVPQSNKNSTGSATAMYRKEKQESKQPFTSCKMLIKTSAFNLALAACIYHLDAACLNKCTQEGKPSCHPGRVDDSIGRSIIKGLRIRQTTGGPNHFWKGEYLHYITAQEE